MSHATSIFDLPRRKRTAAWNLFVEQGMTPECLLGLLDAPKENVRRWIAAAPGKVLIDSMMIYDAKRVGTLLGIETPDTPAPAPSRPGERIIYLPASIISPTDLRATKAPMQNQNWYDDRGYTAQPGYWGVMLPVPESNHRNQAAQDEHRGLVLHGYQRTPMLVDTLLRSVELLASGKDLLNGDWVRCPERTSADRWVGLFVNGGRVSVSPDWPGDPRGVVWSSAARWISP